MSKDDDFEPQVGPPSAVMTTEQIVKEIWKDIIKRRALEKKFDELEQAMKKWMACSCDTCSGKACEATRELYAVGKKL